MSLLASPCCDAISHQSRNLRFIVLSLISLNANQLHACWIDLLALAFSGKPARYASRARIGTATLSYCSGMIHVPSSLVMPKFMEPRGLSFTGPISMLLGGSMLLFG